MNYTVGELARLAQVSVRALHHYDEAGVLKPSGRSEAGYRLYTEADLERLQQVLLYKALGFSLAAIRQLLQDPGFDRRQALREQRELILRQQERLGGMLTLVDRTLAYLNEGTAMATEEMFAGFGDFDPAQFEEEARERWGHTDSYRESARRAAGYTQDDWRRFKQESDALNQAIAALIDAGVPPDDARALALVEQHRLQIDRWFCLCSREMHAALGEMYVADPRFTATYDKIRPGMAAYLRAATQANLRQQA